MAEYSREETIARLVKHAAQWGITRPNGQPFTAVEFQRASDIWLLKQAKRLDREGRKLARNQ